MVERGVDLEQQLKHPHSCLLALPHALGQRKGRTEERKPVKLVAIVQQQANVLPASFTYHCIIDNCLTCV